MSFFSILILGIVEGLTEFLPISSTFHLIVISKLLNLSKLDFIKLFEVFIQGAAIFSVLLIYWKKILTDFEILRKIFISFLPTAVIGFVLYRFIKNTLFESYFFMFGVFVLVGIIFIWLEILIMRKKIELKKKIKDISYQEAFLIGFFQSLAVIPGVSRAGAVIVFMLLRGYKRDESVLYSFLLAIPTIISASVFDLYKSKNLLASNINSLFFLGIGSVVSFISAYISVKWLLKFISKNNLVFFGLYRILVGIIILIIFLIKNFVFVV